MANYYEASNYLLIIIKVALKFHTSNMNVRRKKSMLI